MKVFNELIENKDLRVEIRPAHVVAFYLPNNYGLINNL